MAYMLMLVSMALTLMQGHSGSAEAKNSMLNYVDKQASYKHWTCYTGWPFLRHLDFANDYMAWPSCSLFSLSVSVSVSLLEGRERGGVGWGGCESIGQHAFVFVAHPHPRTELLLTVGLQRNLSALMRVDLWPVLAFFYTVLPITSVFPRH